MIMSLPSYKWVSSLLCCNGCQDSFFPFFFFFQVAKQKQIYDWKISFCTWKSEKTTQISKSSLYHALIIHFKNNIDWKDFFSTCHYVPWPLTYTTECLKRNTNFHYLCSLFVSLIMSRTLNGSSPKIRSSFFFSRFLRSIY